MPTIKDIAKRAGFSHGTVFLDFLELRSAYSNDKLNFLSLSSPSMKAIKYLLPDFETRTGIKVNLVEVPMMSCIKSFAP